MLTKDTCIYKGEKDQEHEYADAYKMKYIWEKHFYLYGNIQKAK